MKLKLPPGTFDAYLSDYDGTIADSMPPPYLAWRTAPAEWKGMTSGLRSAKVEPQAGSGHNRSTPRAPWNGSPCAVQRCEDRFSKRKRPDLPATTISWLPSPSISATAICIPAPVRVL